MTEARVQPDPQEYFSKLLEGTVVLNPAAARVIAGFLHRLSPELPARDVFMLTIVAVGELMLEDELPSGPVKTRSVMESSLVASMVCVLRANGCKEEGLLDALLNLAVGGDYSSWLGEVRSLISVEPEQGREGQLVEVYTWIRSTWGIQRATDVGSTSKMALNILAARVPEFRHDLEAGHSVLTALISVRAPELPEGVAQLLWRDGKGKLRLGKRQVRGALCTWLNLPHRAKPKQPGEVLFGDLCSTEDSRPPEGPDEGSNPLQLLLESQLGKHVEELRARWASNATSGTASAVVIENFNDLVFRDQSVRALARDTGFDESTLRAAYRRLCARLESELPRGVFED